MTALTFDLETCTATLNKRKASPFHPDNYIVASGFKRDDSEVWGHYFPSQAESKERYSIPITEEDDLLIGFNIKFDLLYSWDRPELQAFIKRGGRIWDCQYVEYLLEGHRQHAQMASMDGVIESYGGTLKIDEVKALWKAGVDTPDIHEHLLMDYLMGTADGEIAGDVNNTYMIYQGQLDRIKEMGPNFTKMVERRMDGLLCTTEMEYNGLNIDLERGEADRKGLHDSLGILDGDLQRYIPDLPPELVFNWQSIYHKSYLIYGGAAKYQKWVPHRDEDGEPTYANKTEQWPLLEGVPVSGESPDLCYLEDRGIYRRISDSKEQDVFKAGKRQGEGKTKNVTVPDSSKPKGAKQAFIYEFSGYTKPDPQWASTLTDGRDNPIFSTASDTLEFLADRDKDVPFIQLLTARNKAKKDLGTYYWFEDANGKRKGMLTLVGDDNIIHHKLNHTSTVTTRLTSNDPNMQNIPRGDKSDAKAMFTSRFGDEGQMVEIDYSQLEVVVQAILTKDKQLIIDLTNGVDFHVKRLAAKLGEPYAAVRARCASDPAYKAMRTNIKAFTFQRAYGAGATKIAASTGMTVEEVEELIRVEELMYPGISAFDGLVEDSIGRTRQITNSRVTVAGNTFQLAVGNWDSPTGTHYVWSESEVPKFLHRHGKFVGFSPTERKNWPVQGEGGFIVQAMLGYLFRHFNSNANYGGKAFLVNTVHDCVWLDVHKDVARDAVFTSKAILESVPAMYRNTFGMEIPVKFPVDAEIGVNMLDLQHFKG
jgi:DNA polymerase-1